LARGRNTGTEAPVQAFAAASPDFLFGFGVTVSLAFVAGPLHHIAMNLILMPHNVTLTEAIQDHIIARIEKLEHLDRFALNVRVTLEHDQTKAPERQFSCAMRLSLPGPDPFAEDAEADLYAAIDLVAKKIEQQIRKRHNKFKARKHKQPARGKRTRQDNEAKEL
jgi:putative sigma-54 modulation protein